MPSDDEPNRYVKGRLSRNTLSCMARDFESMDLNLGIEATVAGQINDAPLYLARLGDSVQLTVGPVVLMLDCHRAAVLGEALTRVATGRAETAPSDTET